MAHPLVKVKDFSYSSLSKELELGPSEKEYESLLQAYLEDFWQQGVTLLPPAQGGYSGSLSSLLEQRYVFRNVIKEVIGRVVGAFYGKAPNWRFQKDGEVVSTEETAAPPAEGQPEEGASQESAKLQSIDKALSDFFVRQQVSEEMGKAFAFRLAFGRGSWRLYIPAKYKTQKGGPTAPGAGDGAGGPSADIGEEGAGDEGDLKDYLSFTTIEEAIGAMRIEFVPPQQGRVLDEGGELLSMVKYSVRKDWSTKDYVNVIEFSFIDDKERTFIGVVKENDTGGSVLDANLSSPFNLDGLTTLGEFKGAPYVTKALYKNNQLLNLALTCAGFSLVDNGFGEVILTNVELETRRVQGPDGEPVDVPTTIKRGGGAIQNFVGIETVDETGAVRRESPGVNFRDPSPVNAFKEGYDLGYVACLQEAGQLYAITTGDAAVSGESRIQALSDFVLKVNPYKSEVDEQGGHLLTLVLLWAAELSGTPMPGYKVVYDSKMQVAQLSNEEKATVISMRNAGAISKETEMILLGVEDPTLEKEIMLREQSAPIGEITSDELSARADLGLKLSSLGIDNQTIQKEVLRFTDAQIAEMARRQAEEQARIEEEIRRAAEAGAGAGGFNP